MPRVPGHLPPCRVEQWGQSMALACEPLADSGPSISHWTPHEWADAAIKRGRGETIAERQGGVVSTHVALKPHRSRYGLNRAPDEAAAEKMADVTSLSWQAPA
jgi:hypothetical protein